MNTGTLCSVSSFVVEILRHFKYGVGSVSDNSS
jgi:hypothetical protein